MSVLVACVGLLANNVSLCGSRARIYEHGHQVQRPYHDMASYARFMYRIYGYKPCGAARYETNRGDYDAGRKEECSR